MQAKQPNILWICTDQQRYDTIGALGYPGVSTPNIDRLVHEGVAFERAYCQSPICTPSRASFLTGTYPSVTHNIRNGNDRFVERFPLITRTLADTGYDCGLIGKLHLAGAYRRMEPRTDDGYRYWQFSHAPRDDWKTGHDYADWVRSKGSVLGELTKNPEGVPAHLHQTTWCAEKTIEFIKQKRSGPWLASVNIYDPHLPFNPPGEYRKMFDPGKMPDPLFRKSDLDTQRQLAGVDFLSAVSDPSDLDIASPVIPWSPQSLSEFIAQKDGQAENPPQFKRDAWTLKAAYYAMIKLIDDQIGRILDVLEETGQRENTLIIFTSDHGEMLGDHGLISKGCRFYEGLVHVPLIMSWPGQFSEGLIAKGLVELLDIAPTLLNEAALTAQEWMQGRSLSSILRGQADPDFFRESVRCEYYDAVDRSDGTFATMYLDTRYKLVVYHGHNLGELYDLKNDPGEFDNLWSDPAFSQVKMDLLLRSFDKSMLIMDRGTPRIGPM